jgi:phosphonate transport system substrate-binding protein
MLRILRPFVALAALGFVALAGAQDAVQGYRFSPVNQYGINLTAEYWNPIIDYVAEKSGVKMKLKIGRTSADTTAYVLANEAEFVFTNHLFSPEREQLGWKVFGRRQTPPVRSQIIVAADSPVTSLAQLAGAEVAFPGPEALVAYKVSYAHLLEEKVDVKVVFAGNHDAAFVQLFSGKVKAVGANSQLVDGYVNRENKKIRVVWQSAPFYDLALEVSPRVPEKDAKAVAAAFLGMAKDPTGLAILHKASQVVGLEKDAVFIPSDGSEYAAYRTFYKSAPPQLR